MIWLASALAAEPVALVELFTSEGCSSCPPADAALDALVEASEGKNVYALSFHVDYWDRLGWKDPWSDARWTGRQREYSRIFRQNGRVYTPQAVVNGREAFVGSKEDVLRKKVTEALERPAAASVTGTATRVDGAVRIEVNVVGAPIGGELFVAVAEDRREVDILKGENAGKKGVHRHVVRAMVKADTPASSGKIDVPADFLWDGAQVYAWVADPLTLEVVGAARLLLAAQAL